MFGGTQWVPWAAGAAVFSFIITGFSVLSQAAGSGKMPAGILARMSPILIGLGLYVGFITPKENVNVQDVVLSRTETVANVPIGISKTMWVLNLFQRTIVHVADTATPIVNVPTYAAAGHVAYAGVDRLIKNAQASQKATQTLERYMRDCVLFEMTLPDSTLTIDEIVDSAITSNLITVLGKAQNPSIYTVSYTGASPSGVTKTCTEAYADLSGYFQNASNATPSMLEACKNAGFLNVAQCKANMQSTLAGFAITDNVSLDIDRFSNDIALAKAVADYYGKLDPAGTAAMVAAGENLNRGAIMGALRQVGDRAVYMQQFLFFVAPILVVFLTTPIAMKAVGAFFYLATLNTVTFAVNVATYHIYTSQLVGAGGDGEGIALLHSALAQAQDFVWQGSLLAAMILGFLWKSADSASARLLAMNPGRAYEQDSGSSVNTANRAAMMQQQTGMAGGNRLVPSEAHSNMGAFRPQQDLFNNAKSQGEWSGSGGLSGASLSSQVQASGQLGKTASEGSSRSFMSGALAGQGSSVAAERAGWEVKKDAQTGVTTFAHKESGAELKYKDGELLKVEKSALGDMKLAQQAQAATEQSLTKAAQEVHAANQEKSAAWQEMLSAGMSGSSGRGVTREGSTGSSSNEIIGNAINSALKEVVTTGGSMSQGKSKDTQHRLDGGLTAGTPGLEDMKILKGKGGYTIIGTSSDNTKFERKLDANEAKAFEDAVSRNLQAGIQNATSTKGSVTESVIKEAREAFQRTQQAGEKVSRTTQASEAAQEAHKAVSALTAGGGVALETHAAKWFQNHFGFNGADGQLQTQEKLREMATNDPKALQELIGKYVDSFGVGSETKLAAQAQVENGNNTKAKVDGELAQSQAVIGKVNEEIKNSAGTGSGANNAENIIANAENNISQTEGDINAKGDANMHKGNSRQTQENIEKGENATTFNPLKRALLYASEEPYNQARNTAGRFGVNIPELQVDAPTIGNVVNGDITPQAMSKDDSSPLLNKLGGGLGVITEAVLGNPPETPAPVTPTPATTQSPTRVAATTGVGGVQQGAGQTVTPAPQPQASSGMGGTPATNAAAPA
ncbi:MAG: conjugal transfer protein TraG N-terminal domain-containing protein, partial [Trichlorobacter sp.]|nr:conjugal transfer protein TraG N-terminal domain-containing protein [Trichlorobacter sp.]